MKSLIYNMYRRANPINGVDYTYSSSSSLEGERTPLTGNSSAKLSTANTEEQQQLQQQREIYNRFAAQNGGTSNLTTTEEEINVLRQKHEFAGTSGSCMDRFKCILAVSASVVAIALCGRTLWTAYAGDDDNGFTSLFGNDDSDLFDLDGYSSPFSPANSHDDLGRFILNDYDARPPFSDFLPGLAGIYGIPLYAFFVNRGQGITALGVESKDYPILEFNAANKAYQNTALLGFRTFIKGTRSRSNRPSKTKPFYTEPFSPMTTRFLLQDGPSNMPPTGSTFVDRGPKRRQLPKRIMYTGANEMQIQEIDTLHNIETNVTYFILPEEDFGAFVRRTRITNLHKKESLTLSLLDGIPKMEPYGGKLDNLLKNMGRTLEGWMGVYFPYKDSIKMPFYRLSSEPTDSDSVRVLQSGHYCLSFVEGDPEKGTETHLLPIIYDRNKVFGEDTTLLRPLAFMSKSLSDIVSGPQYGMAKTSSAFAAVEEVTLRPGEGITISSFYGAADHIMDVPVYARRLMQDGFVQYKLSRTREVIKQITAGVETNTRNKLFDGHVQQMFLDNSLRGGIPIILGDQDDNDAMETVDENNDRLKVFHAFSRIHGDLERDYNQFILPPTFFSQGPGNFRDVIQNRRNDVVFNPRVGSFNIRMFLSFIQADAYEPLSVEAAVFSIKHKEICDWIATNAVGPADGHRAQREALSHILSNGPFRPGQLFKLMKEQHIELLIDKQDFIDMVASGAEWTPMAVYETGFWADHWTYYIDMIESYLSIFPEKEEHLLYDEKLPYYFSPASVQPRSRKYVLSLSYDGTHEHIRQLDATVDDEDKKKHMDQFILNSTGWYELKAHWQLDKNGNKFTSSPIAKLFLLATIKFATRDAYGMGIEYEGGRPGWDDANNGMVAMLGSGMPETFELKVLLRYLQRVVTKYQRPIVLPIELRDLIDGITTNLQGLSDYVDANPLGTNVPNELFHYWDKVATAREEYRDKVRIIFSGFTTELQPSAVLDLIDIWLHELDLGVARAMSFGSQGHGDDGRSGIAPSYFAYNVTDWTRTGQVNSDGHPWAIPKGMLVRKFPLFLEGPTRMMKTIDSQGASEMYQKVRHSVLRDEGLSMYTVSASLKGQSLDMGRLMAFAPGWLENQAVWLHMSYKFYLEILRHKLYDEFYEEMLSGGVLPYMRQEIYGRSLMECSSFIASSAFEDPSVRGRGFLARLSGSTAEFLSMWILMFLGPTPFYVEESTGELRMQLVPALPIWLFDPGTNDGSGGQYPRVSFKLFASIDVHYINERRTDLFGVLPTRYRVGLRDGSVFDVPESSIHFELADKIRRVVFVDFIEAYY